LGCVRGCLVELMAVALGASAGYFIAYIIG